MNNYWLSRRGGAAEGPFAESQIISMWQQGLFAATDMLCMDGTGDWQPASKVLIPPKEPEAPPMPIQPLEMPAWRKHEPSKAHKRRHRPYVLLSWLFFLVGIFFLFYAWPVGVLFILIAMAVDRPVWSCGLCGNSVSKTSRICPACQAQLLRRSEGLSWLVIGSLIAVCVLLLVYLNPGTVNSNQSRADTSDASSSDGITEDFPQLAELRAMAKASGKPLRKVTGIHWIEGRPYRAARFGSGTGPLSIMFLCDSVGQQKYVTIQEMLALHNIAGLSSNPTAMEIKAMRDELR